MKKKVTFNLSNHIIRKLEIAWMTLRRLSKEDQVRCFTKTEMVEMALEIYLEAIIEKHKEEEKQNKISILQKELDKLRD